MKYVIFYIPLSYRYSQNLYPHNILCDFHFTLRRPNGDGVNVPVVPDPAQTVKVGSDHSEILTKFFCGAKNANFS